MVPEWESITAGETWRQRLEWEAERPHLQVQTQSREARQEWEVKLQTLRPDLPTVTYFLQQGNLSQRYL